MVTIIMNALWNTKQYQQDLATTVANIVAIERLANTSILITGATGLIGSYLVDTLLYANEQYNLNMTILACGRNIETLKEKFSHGGTSLTFVAYDVNTTLDLNIDRLDYIIHAASNAHPDTIYSDPVGTITANVQGTNHLLALAQRFPKCRFLFVSSGEVYGQGDGKPFMEDYVGYIEIGNPRSSYPMSKRCAENLCVSYVSQYGVDAVIARLCHTFGPNNIDRDSRAIAQFLKKAINGEDIVLNSSGSAIRSYSYISDTVSGMLTILITGERGHIYNVSNNSEISISQLAEMIGHMANVMTTYNITNFQASPFSYAVLDNAKLLSLGWIPQFTVELGVEHTLDMVRLISKTA